MCYTGTCIYERRDGECRLPGKCPFDDDAPEFDEDDDFQDLLYEGRMHRVQPIEF